MGQRGLTELAFGAIMRGRVLAADPGDLVVDGEEWKYQGSNRTREAFLKTLNGARVFERKSVHVGAARWALERPNEEGR